jgi:hypothetical protein
MGEKRNAYRILLENPKGRTPFGRYRHRREDSRMDVREIGWEVVSWIHLARDRDQCWTFVDTVMNFRVQLKT